MQKITLGLLAFVMALGFGMSAFAHGGALDANRCHTDRKTGVYHCH